MWEIHMTFRMKAAWGGGTLERFSCLERGRIPYAKSLP